MPGRKVVDLTNRIFGRWRVLSRAKYARPGDTMWWCLCDPEHEGCGTKHAVAAATLKDGRSRGCTRCAAIQRHRANPALREAGQKGLRKTRWYACRTCGEKFRGTARKRYCSRKCWPSSR